MDDFYRALDGGLFVYFIFVAILTYSFIKFFWRYSAGIFDPLILAMPFYAFASADVFFMLYANIIDYKYFTYHSMSLVVFGGSFYFLSKLKNVYVSNRSAYRNLNLSDVEFYLAPGLAVLFIVQLYSWIVVGIPALMESRLDAFNASGGLGILSRIIQFFTLYVIVMLVAHKGVVGKYSLTHKSCIIFLILLGLMNGGKSFFLYYFGIAFVADFFLAQKYLNYKRIQLNIRECLKWIAVAVIFALLAQFVEFNNNKNSEGSFLLSFAYRFVLSGDGYLWFYGDKLINEFSKINIYTLTFSDFIGLFRITSWNDLPKHPGIAMFQYFFPLSEKIAGPNARIDIIGSLTGDFFHSAFYYFILAFMFWLFRNASAFIKGGILADVLNVAIPVWSASIITDPVLGFGQLDNCLVCIPIVAFFSCVKYAATRR